MNRDKTIERFWSRVSHGPACWEHRGSLGSHGYPQATGFSGKTVTAHRLSMEISTGSAPTGMVLHKCGNKRCVRPDHLYEGTHRDNMNDLSAVGHARRKLSDEEARAVRSDPGAQRDIARRFGVSQRAVYNIKSMKTYRYA